MFSEGHHVPIGGGPTDLSVSPLRGREAPLEGVMLDAMARASTSESAFSRCASRLRRGILSGGDVQALLDELEGTLGNVGLWFSVGRVDKGGAQVVRDIDPCWLETYLPYAAEDPCRAYLAQR